MTLGPSLPRLRGPLPDAVVIGAGAMGAATAWRLARWGRHVVLVDRRRAR